MTIEKLLGYTLSELEAMSDAELDEKFKPHYQMTRPELAKKPGSSVTSRHNTASAQQGRMMFRDESRKVADNLMKMLLSQHPELAPTNNKK